MKDKKKPYEAPKLVKHQRLEMVTLATSPGPLLVLPDKK